jgi:hypothetical protein
MDSGERRKEQGIVRRRGDVEISETTVRGRRRAEKSRAWRAGGASGLTPGDRERFRHLICITLHIDLKYQWEIEKRQIFPWGYYYDSFYMQFNQAQFPLPLTRRHIITAAAPAQTTAPSAIPHDIHLPSTSSSLRGNAVLGSIAASAM